MSHRTLPWLLLLLLGGCEATPGLRFGASTEEPNPRIVEALAAGLGDDFDVGVTSIAGQGDLIAAIQARRLDFAIIEQPSGSLEQLSAVIPLYPSVLHVLVRRELFDCAAPARLSDIVRLGSVYAGPQGSTGYALLNSLAQAGWLPTMGSIELLQSAFGRVPDVFVQFGGILSADATRRLAGYCLVSLGDAAQLGNGAWAEGISYRFPHLRPMILPGGLYPQLSQRPTLTLAVTSLLVTHPQQDVDTVYDVIAHVKESASAINGIYPLAGDMILNPNEPLLTLPTHLGAQRYQQRNAPTFLERYAELFAFFITALVALSSAGVFLVRNRRQAKKDRLDTYFDALLALRAQSGDAQARAAQVRELQQRVTELVVRERIQADSAYVAFVLLSNRLLEEAAEQDLR